MQILLQFVCNFLWSFIVIIKRKKGNLLWKLRNRVLVEELKIDVPIEITISWLIDMDQRLLLVRHLCSGMAALLRHINCHNCYYYGNDNKFCTLWRMTRIWSISDFIFVALIYEGGRPVLSLAISSSCQECVVNVLIIVESARGATGAENWENENRNTMEHDTSLQVQLQKPFMQPRALHQQKVCCELIIGTEQNLSMKT